MQASACFWLLTSPTVAVRITNLWAYSREPMAPPPSYHQAQEGLQRDLPCGRVCLHYHPDLPVGPDWLHGLLQGPQPRRQGPSAHLVQGGGAQTVQVLQFWDPQGCLCPAYIRPDGSGAVNGWICLVAWVIGLGSSLEKADNEGSIRQPPTCRWERR